MLLLRSALIILCGCVAGFAWNGYSGRGFALGRSVFVQSGDEVIDVQEARARLSRGALFLDARPVAFWEMGHVPGALSLPEDDFQRVFPGLEERLRKSYNVVVYCSGFGCPASHDLARKLAGLGIHAAVLGDGWPAWTDAGLPIETRTPNP